MAGKTQVLTAILKKLGIEVPSLKKAVPPMSKTKPALKAKPKVVSPKPKVKAGPKLSKPTAGAGRGSVQSKVPPMKATTPSMKAKTKIGKGAFIKPKKKSTALVPTKPTAVTKQPGTSVAVSRPKTIAKRPSTAVTKKPGTAIVTPKGAGPDKIVGLSNKGKAALAAAAGLAGAAGTGYMLNSKDKAKAATTSSKASMAMPKTLPKSKPSQKALQSTGPTTRGSAKRTSITAGPNTGFGPKGNRFPGNAEERAALMKMYGGTGAEAAKAAMAGKQGNLAAGKADYEAARIKRLKAAASTGDRKKGGKVGTKSKNNSVVARQVRGWGKARKR